MPLAAFHSLAVLSKLPVTICWPFGEKATEKTHILNDLKVNSARLVDIIIKCEDTFGIEIDDEDADKIRTIGDAIGIIRAKVA